MSPIRLESALWFQYQDRICVGMEVSIASKTCKLLWTFMCTCTSDCMVYLGCKRIFSYFTFDIVLQYAWFFCTEALLNIVGMGMLIQAFNNYHGIIYKTWDLYSDIAKLGISNTAVLTFNNLAISILSCTWLLVFPKPALIFLNAYCTMSL